MKITQSPSSNTQSVNKTSQTTKGNEAQKLNEDKKVDTRGSAQVEISDKAKLMQQALEVTRSIPDVRSDKVSALKKSIQDGTYKVDSEKIADRMLEDHLISDFGKNNL